MRLLDVMEDPYPERDHLRLAAITSGLLVTSAGAAVQIAWLVAVAAVVIALATTQRGARSRPPRPPARDKV